MSMVSEFKEFAMKGNVMDLAVGVIIGGAFGKVVDSIVGDLIMPIGGKIFGGLDFNNYFIPLAGQTATTLARPRRPARCSPMAASSPSCSISSSVTATTLQFQNLQMQQRARMKFHWDTSLHVRLLVKKYRPGICPSW